MTSVQLFIVLLMAGLLLVGAEIFVPGGVVGVLGAIALVGAVITAFIAFGAIKGGWVAIGILFLVGVSMALWIKFFPKSQIGRKMTVETDLSTGKATETGLEQLRGKEGEAVSDLRPAGFAIFDGRRVDVVTQGGMLSKGTKIRVIDIEGNRVVVNKI